MYVGFLVGFGVAWSSGWFEAVFSSSTEPLAVLLGATVACAVGLIDDVKDISAPAKTAGLSLAGVLLAVGGVSIIWFRIPFLDVFVLPYDLALLFSVIWLLGMANAVNFIDGLDGLAAGIVGIGAAAFLLYGFRLGQVELLLAGNVGPLVAALALGICAGFLPWNVHPARIFMGDSGSLLLGTLMAASTMAVGGRTPDPFSGQTFFFYAPLAIPLLILGVPMADTAFAIIRRAAHRQGLATADKDHLHHRLVRLGHGHRRSVGILWAWTALLSAFVLYPTYNEGQGDGIVPMGVGALALALYTLFHPGIQAERLMASRERAARLSNGPPGAGSSPFISSFPEVTGDAATVVLDQNPVGQNPVPGDGQQAASAAGSGRPATQSALPTAPSEPRSPGSVGRSGRPSVRPGAVAGGRVRPHRRRPIEVLPRADLDTR
jgi:UDP-GlcNAc:undecaprenyl-phosphate GlcNAc-1-phosphate transferase